MKDDPYGDPALYDLEYADHREDVLHYVRLACSAGWPVLELGCGTGRLTLPIARAGVAVDGLDLAPGMLEGLRAKLALEPRAVAERVGVHAGDFRTPPDTLQPSYAAVFWPFNTIHHCRHPDDIDATLEAAKARLKPGGTLALDLYLPDRNLYDRDPNKTYEHRNMRDPRTGARLHTWERGWWDEAERIHHVVYTYRADDGAQRETHLRLRMFERDEIEAALERAGLAIVSSAEDFAGTPLRASSLKWVLVLRVR